jgi:hypothetical protein
MSPGFLRKVLSKDKTIESRWSRDRSAPFRLVSPGDTIYFKRSGGPVLARAAIIQADYYELPEDWASVTVLVQQHAAELGLNGNPSAQEFLETHQTKRFASFFRLKGLEQIMPFNIDKSGFSPRASWLALPDINPIRQKKG